MKNHHLITLIYAVCLLCVVSGCTTTPEENQVTGSVVDTPTPRPSPTTRPSPTDTASPTPEPDFLIPSITILDDLDTAGFSILGFFVNHSSVAVTEVEIRPRFHFQSGETTVWEEINLPYQHVLPSEMVPFLIDFPIQPAPESVSIEVVNFQQSGYEDAILEVELTGTTVTSEGVHILYVWMTNPVDDPAQVHLLQLLVGSSSEDPLTLLSSSIHPSSILPYQSVPFLFTVDFGQYQVPTTFTPFVDATFVPELPEPNFTLPQYPEVILDPQGNLLLRGILQNQDVISRWASAEVAILYQNQIISLAPLNLPSPLGPGETRGFGLTNFPGWKVRLDELGGQLNDLSIEVFYDPLECRDFKGQVVHLTVDITGFESTGSTLLIKGNGTNPANQTLSLPAILAEIRTTGGVLQTSDWILLDKIIAEGQTIDFTLGIRLPMGITLSEMEIDVTGTAILEDNALSF